MSKMTTLKIAKLHFCIWSSLHAWSTSSFEPSWKASRPGCIVLRRMSGPCQLSELGKKCEGGVVIYWPPSAGPLPIHFFFFSFSYGAFDLLFLFGDGRWWTGDAVLRSEWLPLWELRKTRTSVSVGNSNVRGRPHARRLTQGSLLCWSLCRERYFPKLFFILNGKG